MLQRYISKELTHFIGRGLRSEENFEQKQYLLLKKILEEGLLKGVRTPEKGLAMTSFIDPEEHFATGNMIQTWGVCFCDIPSGDLGIHIRKYSRFGLSFLKSFLVSKGANPVFYIAQNGVIFQPGGNVTRSVLFKERINEFSDNIERQLITSKPKEPAAARYMEEFLQENPNLELQAHDGSMSTELIEFLERIRPIANFFSLDLLSFLKFFDTRKEDSDKENYYMEREWRIFGNLKFELDDVYRVIMPKEFAKRFRKDMPNYTGQLTLID